MTGRQANLAGKHILLDCRFLGLGGAGRVTELLLRGLRELQPPGRWIVWGPPGASEYLWQGSTGAFTRASPLKLWGQRYIFEMPSHDVAIYMHQIRPWRRGPSLTFVHDTISSHFGNPVARWLKRSFFGVVAHVSTLILTDSHYSADCLQRDLGLPKTRVRVVDLPLDETMGSRVRSLREVLGPKKVILYVGRFVPHKNLDRLIEAFSKTRFFDDGGTLHLVGGTPREVVSLSDHVNRSRIPRVVVEGKCSQERLEELYATSTLLTMPSLEEGFGLPALEALAAGLRISVSDGGALPEIFGGYVEPFDALSVSSMAEGLDRDAINPPPIIERHARPKDLAEAVVAHLSTIIEPTKQPSMNRTRPS